MSIWDTITGRRARVSPQQRSVVMKQRCGCFGLRYTVGDPADYIFTIDIYAYMDNAHPERHLGWWRFELPRDAGPGFGRDGFRPDPRGIDDATGGGRACAIAGSVAQPGLRVRPAR